MDIRDIIVVLGLLAIVLIVWDGLRRMKSGAVNRPKRSRQKPALPGLFKKQPVKPQKEEPYVDPEELKRQAEIARELPNGGARVRPMTDDEKSEVQTRLNLRERVPMLMERVDVAADVPDADEEKSEPEDIADIQPELDFAVVDEMTAEVADPEEHFEPLTEAEPQSNEVEEDQAPVTRDMPEDALEDTLAQDSAALMDAPALEAETEQQEVLEPRPTPEAVPQADAEPAASEDSELAEAKLGPVEDLVIIHVMAPEGKELDGSAVLEYLIASGLRHGPMDIFHYRNPKGHTEFSLANCLHPGTFDPDAMNQLQTPGLTLFIQLPTLADPMESFEHMYEMAKYLAKYFDARVLDEDHSTVTPQRVEYYRDKLRNFTRAKMIPS